MKLNVQFTNGDMKRFDDIWCLDARDEQKVCRVFHVDPQKIQLETLESQKIDAFWFNKVGALCSPRDEWYYMSTAEDSKEGIKELYYKIKNRNIKKYNKAFDIVIPPKTWFGYKNEDEIEKYAKELGGHIADVTEWALWVTQRLQEGETLFQLNRRWLERDWQWIVKDNKKYCCIGGSVIDFYFASEFHNASYNGGVQFSQVRNFRCAIPLIVVPQNKISQSDEVRKSLTIEITYRNRKKEQIHNVKKYIIEDKKISLNEFEFEFLPNSNEIISVDPRNINFEMFESLFIIEDLGKLQFMNELSKAVRLVKKYPNASFAKPFQLIMPDRMHNTQEILMRVMARDSKNYVKNAKGMAGKIHLLVWCAELISKGKDWKEIVKFKVNSKWSRLLYIDKYGFDEGDTSCSLGNIGFNVNAKEYIAYNTSETIEFLFCKDGFHKYNVLDGTLKNVFFSEEYIDKDTFDMVPILVEY